MRLVAMTTGDLPAPPSMAVALPALDPDAVAMSTLLVGLGGFFMRGTSSVRAGLVLAL
jgi:hypothetical protein